MEKKIAVKVSNQQEYDAFRRHCEEAGQEGADKSPKSYSDHFNIIPYGERWDRFPENYTYMYKYEIISFPTFAKLKGIEIPKKEIVIDTANYTLTVSVNEVLYVPKHTCGKQIFFKQEVTEIYTALKSLEEN